MKPGRNIEPLQHRRYPHRGPTGTTHSADIFTDVHTPTAPHQIDKYKRKRDNGQQHRHRNDGVDDTHELCGTRVTLVWSAPTVARRTHRAHFEHDGANTGGRGQHYYQSTEHPELRKKLNRAHRRWAARYTKKNTSRRKRKIKVKCTPQILSQPFVVPSGRSASSSSCHEEEKTLATSGHWRLDVCQNILIHLICVGVDYPALSCLLSTGSVSQRSSRKTCREATALTYAIYLLPRFRVTPRSRGCTSWVKGF